MQLVSSVEQGKAAAGLATCARLLDYFGPGALASALPQALMSIHSVLHQVSQCSQSLLLGELQEELAALPVAYYGTSTFLNVHLASGNPPY